MQPALAAHRRTCPPSVWSATTTLTGACRPQVWDTAGQERFRSLQSSYYRGCHGIILVFDVNDRQSFKNLDHWLEELELYATTDYFAKLLVGNKIDLKQREVGVEEATAFARKQASMYIETSAKTRDGVRQAFEEVVQKSLRATIQRHPGQISRP